MEAKMKMSLIIMQGVSINIFVKNRNSSLTQSLNDCGGLARSFMPDKLPSPHLAKHSNLTQDTRISRSQHSEDSNEKPQKLAQIHHYDLYGKRSDKTNFLYENTLDSIAWATLEPKEPFYLFIPQNEDLRAEYDKGWSVKDIFKVSSVGVVTGKDSVLIASNEKQLEQQVKDFYNEFDLKFVKNIAYRPFDLMKVYYDTSKVTRPRFEIMQHFLQNDNVGLIYKRGFPNTQSGQGFATDSIIDFRSWSCSGMQGGDYISPLYLKNTESSKDKSPKKNKKDSQENADSKQGQWVENFTPEFRNFIDTKYNEHFAPEQILGYIYAVLFHKDYREKYIDFLKIDFPKIPFVESKEKFLTLSALGQELMLTHLMQDSQQERERERERERENRNDENDLQYWVGSFKENHNTRCLEVGVYNKQDCRIRIVRGQQGWRERVPTLPLPKGVNMGLVCDRGCKLQEMNNIFITQNIIDLHLVGSGSYVFPLYINERVRNE